MPISRLSLTRLSATLALACAAVPLLAQAVTRSQTSGLPQYVMTDKLAYMPMPPELVAAPLVEAVYYSPDGRYALIQREHTRVTQLNFNTMLETKQPPAGEKKLILWDSEDRSSTVVWHAPTPETGIQQVEWLHGSDAALVLIHETDQFDPAKPTASRHSRQSLLRISGSSGTCVEIGSTLDENIGTLSISASPVLPLAVVEELRPGHQVLAAPGAPQQAPIPQPAFETVMYMVNNHTRNSMPIAFHTDDVFPAAMWDVNGNPLITVFHRGPGDVKPTQIWFSVNTRTGASTLLTQKPTLYAAATSPPTARDILVRTTTLDAHQGGGTHTVGLLWLESAMKSETPSALISGDSTEGRLLPNSDVVLYRSQYAFWAVPLIKVSRDVALNAIKAAQRAVIMSKAKQVGLALIMCAEDNEENFPAQGQLNSILPYLGMGNQSMLDGFAYTYAGGPIADIESPAETILGTMEGPGGRAIVYSDGHVKWQQ